MINKFKTKNLLIYDIGMHNGDDTAYYLQRGFNVLAIEANPVLVKKSEARFSKEIKDGRLIILNIGIASNRGKMTFWVNLDHDEWSSFIKNAGCRDGSQCKQIIVSTLRLRDLIKEYGVPYYMKIDIEGNDILCLQDLTSTTSPTYISVEAHSLEYLAILYNLGYRKFKAVDQYDHDYPVDVNNEVLNPTFKIRHWLSSRGQPSRKFPLGSSGPFGEETPGKWEGMEEVAYNWLHYRFGKKDRGTLNMKGWYDFHAKK